MPAVFVVGWMTFKAVGLPEDLAFVWAGVLAQATHLWAVIPVSVFRQRHAFGRAEQAVTWAVTISFGVLVFQIWWSEPWMSQRVVSIYSAFFAMGMVRGVLGDRDVVNISAPVSNDADAPLEFRRHLLKLYTLAAILIIATNETLIAVDTALSTRVTVLSLLPVVLHYFFEIALRLTHPPLDERDA